MRGRVAVMDLFWGRYIVCGRHCCGRHGLYSRHGFGRYSPPCDRHGLILGPLSFVAVNAVAVMVCGRHGIDPTKTPIIEQ